MSKTLLYSVYEPHEIIHRLIKETEPLDGPSGYPVNIKYVADNSTEPPVIYFELYEGVNRIVFDMYCDQDTTLKEFEGKLYSRGLHSLRSSVSLCLDAIRNKTSFDEELDKAIKKKNGNEDNPF